jgi:peptidoglycan-associated lipoprotein
VASAIPLGTAIAAFQRHEGLESEKEKNHMLTSKASITRSSQILGTALVLGLVLGGCAHTPKAVSVAAMPLGSNTQVVKKTPASSRTVPLERSSAKNESEVIFYDFDSSELRPDTTPELRQVAKELQTDLQKRLRIEGNCDERGTEAYNLALGEQRAQTAKR